VPEPKEHHEHARSHRLVHPARDFGRAFIIGVALNFGFVVLEAIFGVLAHSLALIADAGHNLADVLGLVLAWAASLLARTPATDRRTYGFRSFSILAALFNAILLLVSVGAIAWEAIRRFGVPIPVEGRVIIWVSLIGIAINTATAGMFMSGRKGDLNIRSAFLHMAGDAAVSAGVVIAGIAIVFTGLHWIDPVVSLLIAGAIVWGTSGLLRDSLNLALQAVPSAIDVREVRKYLAGLPNVTAVHDLHVWPMSTTQTALTAHLEMPTGCPGDEFLREVCEHLHHEFGIEHSTIQIEQSAETCSLAPESSV
jgi:cobalt-zinc-cadmium efflux system protein